MSDQLTTLFSKIRDENTQALNAIGSHNHPLLVLLKQTLEDQKLVLHSLLDDLATHQDPPVSSLKRDCTHLYHANEVAMPFYESWVRAVEWMPDDSSKVKQRLGDCMTSMHDNMVKAAQLFETKYGLASVKYMIPTFYLPTTK